MRPLPSLVRAALRPAAFGLVLLAVADVIWTTVLLPRATHDRERTVAELPATGGAALVLGCTINLRSEPNSLLEGRLQTALDLYRAGKVRWLLLSGYDQEPVVMRRWLVAPGVPAAAIAGDASAHRTYESLQRAKAAFGLDQVVVVTSDFHLPRVLWLAEHMGLDAVGVPASSARFRRRTGLWLREYAARNRAILDVWFPPAPRVGPHDPPPAP